MLPDRFDNRNRSFINDIFVRAEIVCLSNTWFLTLFDNLKDNHSCLIQAMLPNRNFTTANTGLPNFTIYIVWRSHDSKILFRDLTDEHYLISSNLVSSGAQICTTPNTTAPALI